MPWGRRWRETRGTRLQESGTCEEEVSLVGVVTMLQFLIMILGRIWKTSYGG